MGSVEEAEPVLIQSTLLFLSYEETNKQRGGLRMKTDD